MSERTKNRILKLEQRRGLKNPIICAWNGYIEPKPGQIVVGNGYWRWKEKQDDKQNQKLI